MDSGEVEGRGERGERDEVGECMLAIKELIQSKEKALENVEKEFTLLEDKIQEEIGKAGSGPEAKGQDTQSQHEVEKAECPKFIAQQSMVDLEVKHLNTIY